MNSAGPEIGAVRRQRRLRRAYIAIGAVLVIALIGPMLVPTGFVRNRIVAAVEKATGRHFSIDGGVSFWLLPTPGAAIERMTLANAPWAGTKPMLSVYRVEVDIRTLPLLLGRVEVDTIDIDTADIDLRTDADGRGNWRFEKPAPATTGAARSLVIPVSADSAASPAAAEPAASAPAAPTQAIAEKAKNFSAAWENGIPGLPFLRDFHIGLGRIAFTDGKSGRAYSADHLDIALHSDDWHSPLELLAEATSGGKLWQANLDVANPSDFFVGPGSSLSATVDSPFQKVELKGFAGLARSVKSAVNLAVNPVADAQAQGFVSTIALAGRLQFADGQLSLDLDEFKAAQKGAKLDLRGHATVDTNVTPLSVAAELTVGPIDLDPVLPPPPIRDEPGDRRTLAEIPAAAASRSTNLKTWSVKRYGIAGFRAIDLDATVKGGPVTIDHSVVGPIDFHLSTRNGQLIAELADTAVGDGRLGFRAAIDGTDALMPKIQLTVDAQNIPTQLLSSGVRGSMLRNGALSLRATLSTDGDTDRDLVGNLAGDIRLSLDHGSLALDRLGSSLQKIMGACPAILEDGNFAANAKFQGGAIKVSDYAIKARGLDAVGSGDVNLPNRSLTINVETKPASCVRSGALRGPWDDLDFAPQSG
jgi:AsmA protein